MPEEKTDSGLISAISELKQAVIGLNHKIDEQGRRIAALELENSGAKPAAPAENKEMEAALNECEISQLPPPPPPPVQTETTSGKIIKEALGLEHEPIQPQPKENKMLEEKIAGNWFAKIGVVAIVLGSAFFLKYAFDNGWIGETGRVILGLIAGVAMLALGEKLIRKYFLYSQIISGGGLALLYLSIFAAYSYYSLIPQLPAFLAMAMVTGIGIILSLRYNAMPLIITAIIGGFATPFLVSSGENAYVSLFSYVLILDLAIIIVSYFKKWRELNFIGFIGTTITYSAWSSRYYDDTLLGPSIFFLTLFFFVYSLSALIYNLANKEKSTGTEQILTMLSATAYFSTSYSLLANDYSDFMGYFAFLLAFYYFLWAYTVRAITPDDKNLYQFLAFLTVAFVSLAIPLQFDNQIITIGWTVEAVLLLIVALQARQKPIFIFSAVIAGLALCRLVFIDSQMALPEYAFMLNKRFLPFIFTIAAFYLAAKIFRYYGKKFQDDFSKEVAWGMAVCILIANLLTIFSISQEISGYYHNQENLIYASKEKYYESHPYVVFDKNDPVSARTEDLNNLRNQASIALSLFWLAYAIGLMVAGFIGRYHLVRLGGIALLSLAILKLFFYDLWSLGTLYRIISSICLGIVLLSISFIYQKYKNIIKENLL